MTSHVNHGLDDLKSEPQQPDNLQAELKDNGEGHIFDTIDPDAERRLVRKLDMVILPLMALVYFFQYLDKSSINYAAVFGLRDDLSLNGQQFSWVVSLFYFGQLCSEYPAAYLLSRLRITTFVGATIVVWGGVEMSIGGTKNFAGIAVARYFLGFAEASVSPAFIIITSNWYKRSEHPMRVATWMSMNGISQIVGALLMYAVGGAQMSIASWRASFLVFGGLTCACGVLFLVAMPKDTTTAWFLNAEERELATRRLAIDRATRDRAEFNKNQMWEALKSPLTWIYFWLALTNTLPTAILKYSSTVINGFGYSKFQTMLLGTPSGAMSFVTVWISAIVPRIFPNTRIYTGIFLSLIPLAGSAALLAVPQGGNTWGIVAACWLASCASAPLCSAAALVASNVKGNTKKSVVSAGFFISYCVGCIVSPQAWTESDTPRYTKGCILAIVSWTGFVIGLVVYRFSVRSINKKRNQRAEQGDVDYVPNRSVAGMTVGLSVESDLTDQQDKAFRYSM